MSEFWSFKNYDDDMYYYDLLGPDGELIGRSKGHPNERFAVYGIIDVKNNAASDVQYEIIPDGRGRYAVHLKNLCDDTILTYEGLKSMQDAEKRKNDMKKCVFRTIRGGKRLDKKEIRELKNRLSEWQSPHAMLYLTNDAIDDMGDMNFFNQPGLEFLRESWIAAKFAMGRNAEEARLILDTQPDFELRVGGSTEIFEATEAKRKDEKRGDEYRKGDACKEGGGGTKEWEAVEKRVIELGRCAIRNKLGKTYLNHTQLVIYLNPGSEFGTRQEEIKRRFPSIIEDKKEVLEKFDAVWILWNDAVFKIL